MRRNVSMLLMSVAILALAVPAAGQAPAANRAQQREVFVSVGADANAVGPDGSTALHRAVQAGDMTRVQGLLRSGANANARTRYGVTPLSLAAQNGDVASVEALLNAGANPNTANDEGQTVLMTAARTGNVATIRALLAKGANVNAREGWLNQTALTWAAAQNNAEAARVLIEAGADVNARALIPSTRLAVGGGGAVSPQGGMTPLLYAAREGAVETIRVLADAGAALNLADPNNITPLVYALINGHFDAAAAMLEKGADPNLVDLSGRGPLYVAVDMHSLEFRFNRPDPKLTDKLTSLDLIRMLLDRGAKVDQALTANIIAPKNFATGNRNLTAGSTPFLKAATTSDLEVMKLLVEHGANARITNRTGTNALHVVAGIGWRVIYSKGTQDQAIEAVKYLMGLGLDINATNDLGETALHGAAMRTTDQDANKLIEFLVANGANLYAKNNKGRTALDESEGEEITPENGGGDRRGINIRTRTLLQELMQKNPPPQVSNQ